MPLKFFIILCFFSISYIFASSPANNNQDTSSIKSYEVEFGDDFFSSPEYKFDYNWVSGQYEWVEDDLIFDDEAVEIEKINTEKLSE